MDGVIDVKDSGAQMRRILISVLIATACAIAVYFIGGAIEDSAERGRSTHVGAQQLTGGGFQTWFAAVAFLVSGGFAWVIQRNRAKKRWHHQQLIHH